MISSLFLVGGHLPTNTAERKKNIYEYDDKIDNVDWIDI